MSKLPPAAPAILKPMTWRVLALLSCGVLSAVENPKSKYAEVNGVRLHYFTAGAGEPLVLLHGGLSSSDEFLGIFPALAVRFRVVAPDRAGYGRSADSGRPFSYVTMAAETDALLERLRIESASVIGFSDGGVVGFLLAARYPQRVKKLVAIGANSRVHGMDERTIQWIRSRLTTEGLKADFPQVLETYRRLAPDPGRLGSFLERTREMWLRDPYVPDEDMREIRQPVLLIAGGRNDIRVEHLAEVRALLGESQLMILPNTSHFAVGERPAALVAAVFEFLGR